MVTGALTHRRVSRRTVLIALVAVCAPLAAWAQRATGFVRDSANASPVTGAVVSVLDSARQTVARTLSDAEGRYFVELPASATQLRVVRIGYQPRVIALSRQRGALETVDVRMLKLVTLLSTVLVNDERVCSKDKDRVGALSLWEQARAGLLAAVVAREAHPAEATIMSYQRVSDIRSNKVEWIKSRMVAGSTTRPFQAAEAPSALAEHGYMKRSTDGSQAFLAPDADVLLDDSFAATHCFSAKKADDEHPGAIGLAFEPAKGRDTLVDVAGTLWLEAGVPALRAIEFVYTDRNGILRRNNAGGTLSFHAMPNGVVFIDDWALRLPVRTIGLARQMSTTGGLVLRAAWPDSTHFETALQPVMGTITERDTHKPMADAFLEIPASGDAFFTDSSGRFAIFPILPGKYAVNAADTTLAEYVPPRIENGEMNIVAGRQPAELHFELESRSAAIKSLCRGFDASALSATLLGRLADSGGTAKIPDDVRIIAEWLQEGGTGKHETQTVSVDDKGRFSICGIPRDHAVMLTATHKDIHYADTPVSISPTAVVEAMEWTLDFNNLSHAVAPKLATLRGRVVRSASGGPIPLADVWFPSLDKHATTDSSGVFRLDSLQAGPLLVQIRTIGYGMRRDTVTIAAGRDVSRDFSLSSSATMLDTIRTVASAINHISPGLKGFEARRLSGGGGYFIADSVLRANDGRALANIIMSRTAGANLVPGRSGATYMVSSRKPCSGPVMSSCITPNCYATTYLDGALIYSGEPGIPPPDLQRISVNELSGVEYYPSTGTGPPEYNATGNGCGVLLLWSRDK